MLEPLLASSGGGHLGCGRNGARGGAGPSFRGSRCGFARIPFRPLVASSGPSGWPRAFLTPSSTSVQSRIPQWLAFFLTRKGIRPPTNFCTFCPRKCRCSSGLLWPFLALLTVWGLRRQNLIIWARRSESPTISNALRSEAQSLHEPRPVAAELSPHFTEREREGGRERERKRKALSLSLCLFRFFLLPQIVRLTHTHSLSFFQSVSHPSHQSEERTL